MDFDSSVMKLLSRLKGAYALAVMDKKDPEQLIGVRKVKVHWLLVKGFDENFIASDVMALAPVTNQFIYLEDGQLAFLSKERK